LRVGDHPSYRAEVGFCDNAIPLIVIGSIATAMVTTKPGLKEIWTLHRAGTFAKKRQ
jgi:hypothetical protein